MELPLRARSATDIIDGAFALYRSGLSTFVVATALAYAPWLIVQLIVMSGFGTTFGTRPATMPPGLIVASSIIALGSWVTFSLMSAVMARLGSDLYLDGHLDLPGAVRAVMPHVGAVMVGALLRGVLVALAALAAMLPTVILGLAFGAILGSVGAAFVLLGFILAPVAALYAFARLALVTAAIVIEGLTGVQGIRRSAALTRQGVLHVMGTMLLAVVVLLLLYLAVGLAGTWLGNGVLATVLVSIYTIIGYPMFGLTEMLLYYDMRIRSEGFDIQMMAQALETAVPAVPPSV